MLGFRLYINNTEVDLKDNFPLSFNAQINDIREPEKRTATHSKTITIPASKSNVELFSYIYDIHGIVDTSGVVNYTPDFNPNLKAEALAVFDGVEVFRGIAQLTEIHITDNEEIEFDIVLLGQLINLYDKLGDKYLSELDFTEYNHDYTRAEIEASWTNTSGYVYPLIDYGHSTNNAQYYADKMYPAIFVKQYIDKMFEDAGCTYSSNFFDSAFFQKLIIPFNSDVFKINSDEVLDRKFRASRVTTNVQLSTTAAYQTSVALFNNDTTAPNFDTSTQYGTGTGLFVVGAGLQGNFNFTTFMDITARYVPDTAAIAMKPTQVIIVNLTFVHLDASNNVISYLNTYQLKIRPQGFDVTTDYETTSAWSSGNTDYLNTNTGQIQFQSGAVDLVVGEKVGVLVGRYYSPFTINGALFANGLGTGIGGNWSDTQLFIDAGNNVYDGFYYVKYNVGSYFFNEVSDASYVEGLPINMNNAIPQKVKQKDFLNGIIKLFNLYLEQDSSLSNNFVIEPRDDYYYDTVTDDTLIDLSEKLDISRPLDIQPMGALDAKTYRFKYSEDKDYFNQEYINTWGETYSEREVDVINDFIKNEKINSVIFSPTPSVGSSSNDRVIPRILNLDVQTGSVSPLTSNIRILIYDGLKNTNQVWNLKDSGGLTPYQTYPYCGMLDDPFNPTVSLDWEVPDEIYWTNSYQTINYTNKNLYNQYYKKMITEITDRNSKIVTGWFRITPYTYSLLDFRKLYYFEREYFRLNRIINFNPIDDNVTQMEFVKINKGVDVGFTATEADNIPEPDFKPRFTTPAVLGENIQPLNAVVSGQKNRIAESVISSSVVGDDNTIGEFGRQISIVGNGNAIAGDSSGVFIFGNDNVVIGNDLTLINTNGKGINQSNSTYIQGRAVGGDASVILVTGITKVITTAGDDDAIIYLCDATAGNITISLPPCADYPIGIPLTFKKIDSSGNTVTIDADGSELIDGAANQVIITQYDTIQIFTDNINWWIIY